MRRLRLGISSFLLLAGLLQAYGQGRDAAGLRELVERLPSLSPAELGPYTDEIEAAYKRDPGSLAGSVPALSSSLKSTDPWVRRVAVVLVQGLAMESNDSKFILQFADQLSLLMVSSDEYTRIATINASSILVGNAPDNIVRSLLATLSDKNSSGRLLTGAVGALLVTRPNDARVQEAVLSAVNDPAHPKDLQCQLLYATGSAEGLVGQPIVDNIISIATRSHDVDIRDAAIGAAERVGLRALNPLVSKLSSIQSDPNESPSSRSAATQALKIQSHSVR